MSKSEIKAIVRIVKDFARKQPKIMFFIIIADILRAVRPYIKVVLMGLLLDAVYQQAALQELVQLILLAFGVDFILRALESFTRERFNQKNEYMKEIEARELNRKALVMDYEYLEDKHVQEIRFRGNRSQMGIVGWLLYDVEQVFSAFISIIIAIGIVIPLFFVKGSTNIGFLGSWQFSVLFIALILLVVWANYKLQLGAMAKLEDAIKYADGAYNKMGYYTDILAGVESQKDLRIFEQQNTINQDVAWAATQIKAGRKGMAKCYMKGEQIGQTTSAILGLAAYLFAGLRAYIGMITIGNVVTYASSILEFSKSVALFAESLASMKQVAIYCEDYAEYMDLGKRKYEGTIPMEKRRDNRFKVEFEHVSFRYPGSDEDVIHDLNLDFTIGEKMAIVGKNGSGKTTFIKLLCRLYDVTEGCIKVNGIDIRKYDYRDYCRLFAVVFQDFSMFAFPLGENIAGSVEVDVERAYEAMERAGLSERLAKLCAGKSKEEALATYVGKEFDDAGVSFSGGEKQKMAIARAIYKDAPFVIMDEPTAALDPVSECDVYAGFDKMVGKKTALYISHRLASCRFCNDILVFDKGQVVQRGSHEELEQQDGLYRELWNAQAQYYN